MCTSSDVIYVGNKMYISRVHAEYTYYLEGIIASQKRGIFAHGVKSI